MTFGQRLKKANSFADIFSLVKRAVRHYLGKEQAGLLVGLSDLGAQGQSCLGAFYSMDANTIIINKRPLQTIATQSPKLYNPYLFNILLHEYLQSLNLFDHEEVRLLSYEIAKQYFGMNHLATQMALDMEQFLPSHVFDDKVEKPDDLDIEFVHGIDRDNTNYIM